MKSIKSISLLLAMLTVLLPALQLPIRAESGEAERYILLLEEDCDAERLAKELISDGAEIIYTYDRLLDGMCVSTDAGGKSLPSYDGVAQVLIPQLYMLLEHEESSGLVTEKEAAADARHAAAAIESIEGADGTGTVVAILDGGFDIGADCLSLTNAEAVKLTETSVISARSSLCACARSYIYWKDVWGCFKIPFAYDYAEGDTDVNTNDVSIADTAHGDHVATIIGANSKDGSSGAAPEAQLLLMKVASPFYGMTIAEEGDILAALDDSAELRADVICLPLGSPLLTGEDGTPGYALSLALASAEEAGISVIAAAGNDGKRQEAMTDSPDTDTLHGFAALESVMTVGAADYFMRTLPCMETEDGFRFIFTDTSEDVSGIAFTDAFDGMTLPVVEIPGIGSPEDFEGIALEGMLALIKRGEIPFADKVNNAEAAGAVGVIIYNNEEDAELVNMQLEQGSIPAIFVTMETGEKLAGSSIVISSEAYMQVDVEGGGLISDFSSRGAVDLAAFGASLTPPDAETVYDTVEGTSYAAALTAGYTAALLSHRRAEGGDTTPEGLKTTLMNSAAVIEVEGVPLSPRAQGAGRVSLLGALECELTLTAVDGGASLSLGCIEDHVSFALKLTNNSESVRSLAIAASPTTSGAYSYVFDEESGMFLPSETSDGRYPYYVSSLQQPLEEASLTLAGSEINRFAEGGMLASLTLDAGECVFLTFTLDVSEAALDEIFENGFFAEGYIEVYEDNAMLVSLPFCGFAGERTALPITGEVGFTSYAVNDYIFDEWKLGVNAFDEIIIDKAAFSPNRDGSYEYATLSMELLRDADRFYYELLTGDGEVIYTSQDYIDLYSAASGGNVTVDVWDGSDPENENYVYPDGDYTLRIHLFDGTAEHIIDRTLTLDTRKPEIEASELTYDTLTCLMRDEVGVQYACAYAIDENGLYVSFYTDCVIPAEECRGYTCTFDLTGLDESAPYLYVEAIDYAFNIRTIRIPLGGGAS